MIIASILVAIAITEIVSWWGKLLRSRRTQDVSFVHLAWSFVLISNVVLHWSGFWAYHDLTIVTYPQIWMLLLPTLLAILVAFALTPSDIDLADGSAEYYEANRRPIFFCWSLFVIAAIAADVILLRSVAVEGLIYVAILVVALVSCAVSSKTWVQYAALAIVFSLIVLLPFALGFGETIEFLLGA